MAENMFPSDGSSQSGGVFLSVTQMAENMFPSDGSSQSGGVFSSVTQIPSMEHTGKEPIQAQSQPDSLVQSTARKEPIQAQSQSHSLVQSTGRLKRYKASACTNVIRVGGEIASCKKATSEVCFTISEEEEEETPVQNVKSRIAKEMIGLLDDINENYPSPTDKDLLRTAKEALEEFIQLSNTISRPNSK